tara:strand:+ start:51 stop:1637 length:1587 start_codon:yes stop_codon:yes gene_type:complete
VPKQEYKLVAFHGGINNNSDPKDIQDIELRNADGVSVHKLGQLIPVGYRGTHVNAVIANLGTSTVEPGYGLKFFSTDYDASGNKESEDWLAWYNKTSDKIRFYYRDKAGNGASPGFIGNSYELSMTDVKPDFYYGDGFLRVSDAKFTADSKWWGYIDSELFWTAISADGDTITNSHNIAKWDSGNQKLLSFDKLNIGLVLHDSNTESPNYTDIQHDSNSDAGKIILSYWQNDGEGEWSGRYEFGATPVYIGDQEGPISEFPNELTFFDDELVFQTYIPIGTSNSISDNATHKLVDNRIIGINYYFREVGDDDWIYLMNTDLKKGGQHLWKVYNAGSSDGDGASEKTHGYWEHADIAASGNQGVQIAANITGGDGNQTTRNILFWDSHDGSNGSGAEWMSSPQSGTTPRKGKSFANVYLEVRLDNDNRADGFTGRKGFLRVWGGNTSPIYVGDIGLDANNDVYFVELTLPGVGTDREFRAQVLDENFSILADSGIFTITIEDSGKKAPQEYERPRTKVIIAEKEYDSDG